MEKELGEDAREHAAFRALLGEGDGALFGKVENEVAPSVDMIGPAGDHTVGCEGDAALVVFVGSSRSSDRIAKCGNGLTEELDSASAAERVILKLLPPIRSRFGVAKARLVPLTRMQSIASVE
jgi:hypothetical protein